MRGAVHRPEIELTEISTPVEMAADTLAFAATVRETSDSRASGLRSLTARVGSPAGTGEELAAGRFLLVHAPQRTAEWGGAFRIVTYVKAEVERDLGHDELLASVAWSWLIEALDRSGAEYSREGGTASRLLAEGFGQLADTEEYIDVELRASWTPHGDDLSPHLEAWADMVCTFGGLPPSGDDAIPLRRRS